MDDPNVQNECRYARPARTVLTVYFVIAMLFRGLSTGVLVVASIVTARFSAIGLPRDRDVAMLYLLIAIALGVLSIAFYEDPREITKEGTDA